MLRRAFSRAINAGEPKPEPPGVVEADVLEEPAPAVAAAVLELGLPLVVLLCDELEALLELLPLLLLGVEAALLWFVTLGVIFWECLVLVTGEGLWWADREAPIELAVPEGEVKDEDGLVGERIRTRREGAGEEGVETAGEEGAGEVGAE